MSTGGGIPKHSDLKTPLKRVRGWGSSKSGTHHFVVQRVTAVALIPLVIWFVWFVITLVTRRLRAMRVKCFINRFRRC